MRPNLDFALILGARQVAVSADPQRPAVLLSLQQRENQIGVSRSEVPATIRNAGIHDRWMGGLNRLRERNPLLDAVEPTIEVEFILFEPKPFHDIKKFRRVLSQFRSKNWGQVNQHSMPRYSKGPHDLLLGYSWMKLSRDP